MMSFKKIFFVVITLPVTAFNMYAKDNAIYLWKSIKNMKREDSVMYVHRPSPEKNTGTAVIICPGGSYHHLGIFSEGYTTAKWFSSLGVTAFNLQYRVSQAGYHHPAMLQDIQRAIQYVREHAAEYGINPAKIGAIGYSAGGHLVTMAGAFASTDNELEKIGIHTNVSLRPDFVIPVYPVVSMRDDIANKWSRKSLLGKNMSEERKSMFSMEKQIPDNMPPTYVVACRDDPTVQFVNSQLLYQALLDKKIPCRFAQYDKGGHGFGMKNNVFMKKEHWNEALKAWLIETGFLPSSL